eukprot:TRINITY_DN18921_c0_g1_i1.p1 TRINITY_DN18921_c0_g1~~TRINITY_DN18921_c0_g1_i1.p1  ORF type:complete len:390 (-),score=49.00 TRINITY_DN18921_c0_g1_i1:39-1208(-)
MCVLGIAMITKASGQSPSNDASATLWLYVGADSLVAVQQLFATWNNRGNPQVLPTLQLEAYNALPGMILRLAYAFDVSSNNSTSWDWAMYSMLLDYGCPWLWLSLQRLSKKCCPSHWIRHVLCSGVPLSQDIAFLDARIARIFTIVISLLLSSSITSDWASLGSTCRAEVLIFPSMLVFSYLPFVTGFDREPLTTEKEHARRIAVKTSLAYDHFSCLTAVMFIMLAGLLQRAAQHACSAGTTTFGTKNRSQLLLFHASVLLCSLMRAAMHRVPPGREPKLNRSIRLGCRAVAAFSPFLNLVVGHNSYEADILMLMGCNLICFLIERYGRVDKEARPSVPDEGVVWNQNRVCSTGKEDQDEMPQAIVVETPDPKEARAVAEDPPEFVLSG